MKDDQLTERVANLSPAKRALLEIRLKEAATRSFSDSNIPRRNRDQPMPLSFAQQRLWFLNQLEPESPAYNESRAVRLTGFLDLDAFNQALNRIVARHEVLRTNIVAVDGSPVQIFAGSRAVELPLIDLTTLPSRDRGAEAQRIIGETIRRPFDLSRDLMLRVL